LCDTLVQTRKPAGDRSARIGSQSERRNEGKPQPRSRLDHRARIEGFASILTWNVARDHGEPGQWPWRQATTEVDARGQQRSDLASVLDACWSRANVQATSLGGLLPVSTTAGPEHHLRRRHNGRHVRSANERQSLPE